mmetsp:Transcript_22872/g.22140  ORF Transcript_22872/g.22140 Transcript_22872/m.22140 type:complete len:117 (-) Transcript_22872:15-365(-)
MLNEYDHSQDGEVSASDFQQILQMNLSLSQLDIKALVSHYQNYSASIVVHTFIENINQYIMNQNVNTSLAMAAAEFKKRYSQQKLGGINQQQQLNQFSPQFEEIYKAIIARGQDTY